MFHSLKTCAALASTLLLVGLAPLAQDRFTDFDPEPHAGGPPEALGDLVAGPCDVESGPDDNRCLGVERAWGYYWVTGRGHSATGDDFRIHQYSIDGFYLASYPQVTASPTWGGRDLEANIPARRLYVGADNGEVSEYRFNPNNGALVHVGLHMTGVPGTVRALCRNPNTGNFFTKDFGGDLHEFDLATGAVVNTWPSPTVSSYGFGWDPVSNTIWSTDVDSSVTEIDPLTGAPTGRAFSTAIGGVQGGADVYTDPLNPDFLSIVMLHQSFPDVIAVYDLGVAVPWAPIACAPGGNFGPLAQDDCLSNLTPAVWQSEQIDWIRDQSPRNGIDDLIDASPDPVFDIVVNFRRCITQKDVDFLANVSATSSVSRVCRYITSVGVNGVAKADLPTVIDYSGVAFVEGKFGFVPILGTSIESIKVAAGFYSPDTVEDSFPSIEGSGVNIAIIDTGVDNHLHDAFASTPVVGFYDATTGTFTDPVDDPYVPGVSFGHGTHVASIALGQASSAYPYRGVAPAAGLIDVKALPSTGGPWDDIEDAVETVYDQRDAWDVSIMNLSVGQVDWTGAPIPSDGTDAICQLIDLAESMGILAVVAAGNDGPTNSGLAAPASSTRAVTVGGAYDLGTGDRSDDILYESSSIGPRDDDGDSDDLDELKPEITAPGKLITAAQSDTSDESITASGTSMAAPHIAGVAALILQSRPGMSPGAVKDLMIATAEARGSASLPAKDPTWNDEWGWGYVDAFAALASGSDRDLTFPNHPAEPAWKSEDIETDPFPTSVGEPTTVTATVYNPGPGTALDVKINFGVHVYSASVPTFYDIGSKYFDLPVGESEVEFEWVPADSSHQCVKVEIDYPYDTDYDNNTAQLNLNVAESPVTFQVRNTLTKQPARIDFEVACADGPFGEWEVLMSPPFVVLSGDDCPVNVTALAIPPIEAPDGETITVHVAAKIGNEVLGGVTFSVAKEDCNGNGVDDWFDIQNGQSSDENGNGVPDECEGITYCTAKFNSCQTLPAIAAEGVPRASQSSGFVISASNTKAKKTALLFYTDAGRAAIPFQGGTLCVGPPIKRSSVAVDTTGTPGLCDGSVMLDMNCFASGNCGGNPAAFLGIPGVQVNCQWWGRDTLQNGSLLTDAVEYVVLP